MSLFNKLTRNPGRNLKEKFYALYDFDNFAYFVATWITRRYWWRFNSYTVSSNSDYYNY